MALTERYSLTRSKRKTIAIHIKDGQIAVKAPLKTSVQTIEAFLAEKQAWIEKKLRESKIRTQKYADVTACKSFLYLGTRLDVHEWSKKSFLQRENTLFIPDKYITEGILAVSKEFSDKLKKFYKKIAREYLGNRLEEISRLTGMSYAKFDLTDAKTKWGSCDSANNIRLNWRLVLLQKGLIDYVIVHELSHTVRHDHSQKFWQVVAKFYPSYKEAIVCLKEVGVLIKYLP